MSDQRPAVDPSDPSRPAVDTGQGPADPGSPALSRRGLIRGAGLGLAAASAFGATQATLGARAAHAAAPSQPVDPATLPLLGGEAFPIGLFWPPPPDESSTERYAEIAAAGFTFAVTGNYAGDGNIFGWQLARAKENGLQLLISDDIQIRNMSRWFTITDTGSGPLEITEAEATILYDRARDAYRPSGALAGFNLFDEPSPDFFPSLSRAVAVARRQAPDLLPYVNLLPSDDPAYYQGFVDAVAPDLISYDRYPLLVDGTVDPTYVHNMVIVRETALRAGVPWWIYIQTLAYANRRRPTEAELRWQINHALAYGATGIQYFTYWTPDPARGEGFGPALIDLEGNRTERWDHARVINTGWLQPVGRELKPLVSETVQHAGETPLPISATGFTRTAWLNRATGGPVIVSTFRSADTDDRRRWVFVANRRLDAPTTASVTTTGAVSRIERFDPATGTYTPVVRRGRIDVTLPAARPRCSGSAESGPAVPARPATSRPACHVTPAVHRRRETRIRAGTRQPGRERARGE